MARKKSVCRPIGGLNLDDDLRGIAPTDFVYAKNIRNAINEANEGKLLTNVLGNLKINSYDCPYSDGVFPAGTNRCLGAYGHSATYSIIFLVWNSNGNHGIYRYYRNLTDVNNPYGRVQQVIVYNFGWTEFQRITAMNIVTGVAPLNSNETGANIGDLFYFADPVPRKINLTKGNIVGKHKSWNIYVGQTNNFKVPRFPQIILRDFNGGLILDAPLAIGAKATNQLGLQAWADGLNANFGTIISAIALDNFLQITEVGTNAFHYSVTAAVGVFPALMVASNWYGDTLIDRFFDRCKWAPTVVSQLQYKKDPQFEYNYVKNILFQERPNYQYDDLEPSTYGPWSQVPINNLQCDGTTNITYNYIDVDFNDPLLFDETTLVLLKKLNVDFRQGNTGNDRLITTLNIQDWLDYDYVNNKWFAHYKFYNNVLSSPISTDTAAQEYDDVPQIVPGDELFIKNTMVEGNIRTGYDYLLNPAADYTIKIGANPNDGLFNITLNVRIFNLRANFFETVPPVQRQLRGAIFEKNASATAGQKYVWGGVPVLDNTQAVADTRQDVFQQWIPAGGFIAYVAGQDNFGISQQIQQESGVTGTYLPIVTPNGVIDATAGLLQLQGFLHLGQENAPFNQSDLFQQVTIRNVPNGSGVIRLASHWCSAGDQLGKGPDYDLNAGIGYQKTSTNTWGVNPFVGGAYTGIKQNVFEIPYTINGADVFIGDFIVEDIIPITLLSAPSPGEITQHGVSLSGYLFDAEGAFDQNTLAQNGVTIEKQIVVVFAADQQDFHDGTGVFPQGTLFTDHNGYYYQFLNITAGVTPQTPVGVSFRAFAIDSAGGENDRFVDWPNLYYIDSKNNSVLTALQNRGLSTQSLTNWIYQNGVDYYLQVLIANTRIDLTNKYKTFITGTVVDPSGNGEQGIVVVYTSTGRFAITQNDGTYSILIWSDTKTAYTGGNPPYAAGQKRVVDSIIFDTGNCPSTFSQNNVLLNVSSINTNPLIQKGVPPYSPTSEFLVSGTTLTHLVGILGNALKRGGTYPICYKESDNAGRFNSWVELFRLYIPYETEDLSQFPKVINPATNLPYTAPTFLSGQPQVTVLLNFAPSQFAASFQIGRGINNYTANPLQWAVNQVTYLASIAQGTPSGTPIAAVATSYQNQNATAIELSLSNITTYDADNAGSIISYVPNIGDHVRLIYDRNIQLVQGLYDLEVVAVDLAAQSIIVRNIDIPFEIQSGFTIEVYTPALQASATTTQSIYEAGQRYSADALRAAHNANLPLVIVLTTGDTYWRLRTMIVLDPVSNFGGSYPIILEDPNGSDFFVSNSSDIGRVGTIDPTFVQLTQPVTMIGSGNFLPGTAVNNLSTFDPNTEPTVELDRRYGAIMRLFFEQNNLLAICSNKEVSNFIDRETLYQAQANTGVVASSNAFFGTFYIHAQNLGTDLPATCVTNSGLIFGWKNEVANVWKYQGDGEKVISDEKMITFFKQLQADGVSDAVAIYDRFHEELLITYFRKYTTQAKVLGTDTNLVQVNVPGLKVGTPITVQGLTGPVYAGTVTLIDTDNTANISLTPTTPPADFLLNQPIILMYSLPETIAWFEGTAEQKLKGEAQRWKTWYDFTPENFSSLGAETFSFVNGQIWIHDKNQVVNNFYGIQYNSQVFVVPNTEPDSTKTWYAMYLESQQNDNGMNWAIPVITTNTNQASRILNGVFEKREEYYWAEFKKDLNTAGVTDPIVNGRLLRSSALILQMINNSTNRIALRNIVLEYEDSFRQD